MGFPPYHNFAHCPRLENLVERYRAQGRASRDVLQNYDRYHPALLHKLRSAYRHLQRLEDALTQNDIATGVADEEIFFEVNLLIDGFFHTAGSSLDLLAREVLTYYGVPHPRDVYFRTAEEQLRRLRPGDALLRRLAEPPWKQAFSDYRNVLTHELLLATRFDIRCTMEGAAARRTIVIPLPDDPRADPPGRTYNRNADVLKYSGTCFKRIVTCINVIYGEVVVRATAANSLPI